MHSSDNVTRVKCVDGHLKVRQVSANGVDDSTIAVKCVDTHLKVCQVSANGVDAQWS